MGKAPAFQTFAADFYMDTAGWDPYAVGIYQRLLLYEWVNGGLPDDRIQLIRISGAKPKKFDSNWNQFVNEKFQVNGNKKLINHRMEEVRKEQQQYLESQREKGKKSAKKRWGDRITPVTTTVTERLQPEGNSSSSSSSSINKKNKDIIPKLIFGEFQNVKLTEEEKKKLIHSFGESGTKDRIENLSQYIASKGKKYSSHYATILSWERKNKPKEIPKPKDEYSYVGGKYGTPD